MTTPPSATGTRERSRATGADLRQALLSAAAWLTANAERINALNVFPVPDGDTGTNMSLTLQAAVEALQPLPDDTSVGQVARTAYEAAMLGARGNSGVILSQLLRGFADRLADEDELLPASLAGALVQASEVAYRGISKPVEGTILTVAREAGTAADQAAAMQADLPALLEQTLHAAAAAVAATPQQLDVLRRAGVVDAGGEGYRVILEGAWRWATGQSVEAADSPAPVQHAILHEPQASFGFCTEFLVRSLDLPTPDVKAQMEALGDSVLVVGDRDLVRVHVHTRRPGQALDFAVEHGTVVKVKVENMQVQHEAMRASAPPDDSAAVEPATGLGVVAVASGDGFVDVFRSLGATVVPGGQTMNPSVQDILWAIQRAGHAELVVLPNNANIVAAAGQAAERAAPQSVTVVPTTTLPQGIAALLAVNFEADLATNVTAMQQAASAIHTIEVTQAVRDAEVDGLSVRAGQLLGLYDGRVVAASASAEAAFWDALQRAPVDALEIVTIYHGADATPEAAQALAQTLRTAHPALAVEVIYGGQPHYPFVVSLE